MTDRKSFLRDAWRLIKPYWKSEERVMAWVLLSAIVVLTLGMVYMNVQLNYWNNDFYNSLQDKDKAAFWRLMGKFTLLATIYISLAVYAFYLNQMLQIRWRRWMTDVYLRDWLEERRYYRMQLTGSSTDNPDQRIAEDMKYFVDETLTLSLGFLRSVVTLVSFVGILWTLSGPLLIPFQGIDIVIPGYMVWAAVLYAIAGSWLTHKIGKALIGMNFNQQRFEADFRFSLIRFRENADSIALSGGEPSELSGFRDRFARVVENWWQIMKRQKILNSFTIGYGQAAIIFPYLVAGNRFFSGAIQLGGLMQISSAFGQVQGALSWFIDAYSGAGPNTGFVGWKATTDRLIGFHKAIEKAREDSRSPQGIGQVEGSEQSLALDGLSLSLPDGKTLVASSQADIERGSRWLVRGPSGSGKSTLFRAIAGIWPFGSGTVRRPAGASRLFLPQRPYLPLGSLRDVLSYPSGTVVDEKLREALKTVQLPQLIGRLDEKQNWSLQLSPGEQQRIAIARALIQQPEWLFLDEATSSLDESSEASLYALLQEKLPGTTIVSIGHRSTLNALHDHVLELQDDADGARRLVPV